MILAPGSYYSIRYTVQIPKESHNIGRESIKRMRQAQFPSEITDWWQADMPEGTRWSLRRNVPVTRQDVKTVLLTTE